MLYDEALKVVDKGLKINPKDIELLAIKGDIQLKQKHYQLAIQSYEQILQII
jgi:lipopolysaccharide biosynthesis regulator YciM